MKIRAAFITILISIILTGSFTGCGSKQKGSTVSSSPPFDSVVYKSTPQGELKMYFHFPENWNPDGKYPAILFFHGGGWGGGGVSAFSQQAKYLAGRGMLAARVEYRVFGQHGTRPDKCVEDGKSAVRWVRGHARELGVDPERIATAGGSAGGHIAACTGVIDGFEAEGEDHSISSKPDLLILFSPVMATTAYSKALKKMGSQEMTERLSPDRHLSAGTPPMIMLFGTWDFHLKGAYDILEIAGELGVQAEVWTADDQHHGFFKNSPWLEWTLFLADNFLVRHGFLQGDPLITPPDSVEMIVHRPEGSEIPL